MLKRSEWAIVPAKSFVRGKSRLSAVLDEDARASFARDLLEHVLGVLGASDLDGIMVATDGAEIAELARRFGAEALLDEGRATLAAVIDRALLDLASRGARAAIVLMADLPRLRAEDVRMVLTSLADHDVAVVADHKGRHTNALALSPPNAMPTSFGQKDSFTAHCATASARGLSLIVVENERIAFDVDGPDDHARLAGI